MAASPLIPSTFFGSPSNFVPRPWPPPCLVDVPRAFQLQTLRLVAESFFNVSSESDCFVVIPFDESSASRIARDPNVVEWGSSLRDRRPLAYKHFGVLGLMHLHVEYLAPFSDLFRRLFTGVSLDDLANTHHCRHIPGESADPRAPMGRVPQLFSAGKAGRNATVYLPLPDPPSFPYIAHWMYFGSVSVLARSLAYGLVSWDGLVRNGRFLGMANEYWTMLAELRHAVLVQKALLHAGAVPDDWSQSDETDEDEDDDGEDEEDEVEEMMELDDPKNSNSELEDDGDVYADDEDDDQDVHIAPRGRRRPFNGRAASNL